jgi:phage baseplate assembly protein W
VKRETFKYQPLDLKTDVGIGVALPFNAAAGGRIPTQNYASGSAGGATVFSTTFTTEQQALSNLKNLLLTTRGERYMQPNFGSPIPNYIFGNITLDGSIAITPDNIVDIESDLTEVINFWLPYIILKEVTAEVFPDQNTVRISIVFRVTETGANQRIVLFQSESEAEIIEEL